MKLAELLETAKSGYEDDSFENYYAVDESGDVFLIANGEGDGLAEFIVRELADTFDEDAPVDTAIEAMEQASIQIRGVIAALLRIPRR